MSDHACRHVGGDGPAVTPLETARVLLRRLAPGDAAALHSVVGDPEVMRYWLPGPDRGVAQTAARIAAIEEHWSRHGFGDWAVESRPDGRLIGFAGLHFIADMDEVNVGYALARDCWGQGLGGNVCRLLLDHGFGELGLPLIVAVIDPRNTASIRMAEGCGLALWKRFVWSGRERLAYAITRPEWESSAGLRIAWLADRPDAVPVLAEWFAREWGDLDARNTVAGFRARLPLRATRERLPMCLLGMLRGCVVATASLKYREIEYAPDADFWLGSVYVREDVRGCGHGRAMVAAAEAQAAAKSFSPLYLYTSGKEGLYEALGWRVVGQAIVDGKPAAVMRKHVGGDDECDGEGE